VAENINGTRGNLEKNPGTTGVLLSSRNPAWEDPINPAFGGRSRSGPCETEVIKAVKMGNFEREGLQTVLHN